MAGNGRQWPTQLKVPIWNAIRLDSCKLKVEYSLDPKLYLDRHSFIKKIESRDPAEKTKTNWKTCIFLVIQNGPESPKTSISLNNLSKRVGERITISGRMRQRLKADWGNWSFEKFGRRHFLFYLFKLFCIGLACFRFISKVNTKFLHIFFFFSKFFIPKIYDFFF